MVWLQCPQLNYYDERMFIDGTRLRYNVGIKNIGTIVPSK